LTQITNTTGGNTFSFDPSVATGGNRIAFGSNADLLGTNSDGNSEIFLWDAANGFTQTTITAGGGSFSPSINSLGNRIAFESNADPLGSNADGNLEIFLWDAGIGLIQITNTISGSNRTPSIDAAGDRIAFWSNTDPLGSNADGNFEIFLWDAANGLTQITHSTGQDSYTPSINADGSRIAFVSTADLLGTNGDKNFEIFLWDSSAGLTQITNTSIFSGNNGDPSINAAGDRIAFDSNVGSSDGVSDAIFLWKASTGITQITNGGNSVLPAIDAAGDRIVFRSTAPLVNNGDGNTEIFLWDASTGFTQISNTTNGNSDSPAIDSTGTRIAFASTSDLLGNNGDGNQEIFLASCAPFAVAAIPAVSPLGLGALTALLGLAAAWTLRRRRGHP
jgi:Tol biopolymer transport system component